MIDRRWCHHLSYYFTPKRRSIWFLKSLSYCIYQISCISHYFFTNGNLLHFTQPWHQGDTMNNLSHHVPILLHLLAQEDHGSVVQNVKREDIWVPMSMCVGTDLAWDRCCTGVSTSALSYVNVSSGKCVNVRQKDKHNSSWRIMLPVQVTSIA